MRTSTASVAGSTYLYCLPSRRARPSPSLEVLEKATQIPVVQQLGASAAVANISRIPMQVNIDVRSPQ